jgi:hypothetical protein
MPTTKNDIHEYKELIEEIDGRVLNDAEAKEELTRLRLLYWLLSHRPPAEGEEPYEPPTPPWL